MGALTWALEVFVACSGWTLCLDSLLYPLQAWRSAMWQLGKGMQNGIAYNAYSSACNLSQCSGGPVVPNAATNKNEACSFIRSVMKTLQKYGSEGCSSTLSPFHSQ